MGLTTKMTDGKQSDVHFENRVVHKERECNQQTTHHIGKTGSIRSRSHGRVTSRVLSGAPSHKSEHHKPKSAHHRSPTKSQHSSKRHSSGGASQKGYKSAASEGDHCSEPSRSRSQGPTLTGRERCYDQPYRKRPQPCTRAPKWQTGKYKRDECGSGIVPKRLLFLPNRKIWCKTPLSMYQATIGELGRKLLCHETIISRDVRPGPPSNIEEYILPPCRGYYRKYDCLRPCEEDFVSYKQGKKVYRDRVERYWEPCLSQDQKHHLDINTYAHHNVALGLKVRRFNTDVPCW
ncbi:hypothetical protein V9T40_000966 [Parthenolecanium corni]|uniref:Uncharacterized protein n=1 Tax=Parthenolecanium corni TaxID=536013 RepID=A0AAN9TAJ2_9HEMI